MINKTLFILVGIVVIGLVLFTLTIALIISTAIMLQAQANAAQATANLVGQCITGFMVIVAIVAGTVFGFSLKSGKVAISKRRKRQRLYPDSELFQDAGILPNYHPNKVTTVHSQPMYLFGEDEHPDEMLDLVMTQWK